MNNQDFNRYAPPSTPFEEISRSIEDDGYLGEPQAVGMGRAMGWLRDAWSLFKQRPGKWMGAVLLILLANVVIALIPIVGPLLQPPLMTFLLAGVAYAAQDTEQYGNFSIGDIFSTGFRERALSLLGVGLFTFALTLLYGAIVYFVFGSDVLQAYLDNVQEGMPNNLKAMNLVFAIVYLSLTFLTPTLIILQGEKLFRAIGLSLKGFLRNIGGAFWCSLLIFLAFLGVIFSGAVLTGFLASLAPGLGKAALVLLAVAVLACLPVLFILPYAVYRDLFFERE
ncbi:BPSS1780 family membrane protein [Eikenella corrodens]|uniref:Transmembrane protein n=1 Tax=Eikenella corrodens TaxID=539 RepID=A0A3S9SLG0_EIKCO|nr:BPSS1780 family membrane protein [Eikenella corrodens]AZR60268.1 hypothetical protein ELB75_09720 [Eikenella corrodens]